MNSIKGNSALQRIRLSGIAAMLTGLVVTACASANSETPENILAPLNRSVVGGDLAEILDEKALRKAVESEYAALESGQTGLPVQWKLSDDVYGSVVPQQPYAVGASNCRRYVHTVNSNNQVRTVVGTACRNEQGIWQPLS
jgi:surface antigen